MHAKTTTTPVDPFDVQNNIELPMVVGQNSNSAATVVRQNNNSLPTVVGQNNNSLTMHCGYKNQLRQKVLLICPLWQKVT